MPPVSRNSAKLQELSWRSIATRVSSKIAYPVEKALLGCRNFHSDVTLSLSFVAKYSRGHFRSWQIHLTAAHREAPSSAKVSKSSLTARSPKRKKHDRKKDRERENSAIVARLVDSSEIPRVFFRHLRPIQSNDVVAISRGWGYATRHLRAYSNNANVSSTLWKRWLTVGKGKRRK